MADKKISQLTAATTPLAGSEVLPIVQSGSTVKVSINNVTAGKSVPMQQANISAAAGGGFSNPAVAVSDGTGDFKLVFLGSTYAGVPANKPWLHSYNDIYVGSDAGTTFNVMSGGTKTLGVDGSGNATAHGNFVVGTAAKGIDFSANTHAAGMTSELLNWYEEGTWTPQISSGATDATMGADNAGRYTRIGRVVFIHAFVQTSSVAGIGGGEIQIKNLPFAPNSGYAGYAASCGGWAANLNISAGQVVSFRPNAGATTIQILLWDDAAGTTNMTGTEWSDDGYVSFSLSYMI